MEPVILVRSGTSAPGRAALEWAAREARLRGAALDVRNTPLHELAGASVIVCGVGEDNDVPLPAPGCLSATPVGTARGPVVLVPGLLATSRHRPGVTVVVDPRDPCDAALCFAFESARIRGVRLHAVHAWALPAGAVERPFGISERDRATWEDHEVQLLGDALRPWREKFPDVRVLKDVRLLRPAEALLRCSERAALVVVPRGSAATVWKEAVRDLLRRATCAVAVVPS